MNDPRDKPFKPEKDEDRELWEEDEEYYEDSYEDSYDDLDDEYWEYEKDYDH
ncbi:MAG: hypothetical protein GNW80_14320 [Asgard group archaeon]|nr:hypothetical protein [Asgard group archaeon]